MMTEDLQRIRQLLDGAERRRKSRANRISSTLLLGVLTSVVLFLLAMIWLSGQGTLEDRKYCKQNWKDQSFHIRVTVKKSRFMRECIEDRKNSSSRW